MKLDANALETLIGKDAARILSEANLCVIPRRCLNPLLLQSGVPARELKAKRQFMQDSPLLGLLVAKRQAQQTAV